VLDNSVHGRAVSWYLESVHVSWLPDLSMASGFWVTGSWEQAAGGLLAKMQVKCGKSRGRLRFQAVPGRDSQVTRMVLTYLTAMYPPNPG
jgi:hypothetical protein